MIVTGAGRGFCAGADLSAGAQTFDYDARAGEGAGAKVDEVHRDGGGLLTLRIYQSLKPIIAAVNGPGGRHRRDHAAGHGRIRLASENARFGFVFARRGIAPEAASSWFLPRLVGVSKALEWCYSGRVLPASEALAGRLVRSVHAPDDLLPAAKALAREIADNTAPVSVEA